MNERKSVHSARYLIRLGVSRQTYIPAALPFDGSEAWVFSLVHSVGMKEGSAFTSVAKSAPFSRSLIPEKIRVEVSNIILGGHRSSGYSPSWLEFHATFLSNSHTRPDGIHGSYKEKLG